MLTTAIVGGICLILGGFGGYKWGRSAEAKAQTLLGNVAKKL